MFLQVIYYYNNFVNYRLQLQFRTYMIMLKNSLKPSFYTRVKNYKIGFLKTLFINALISVFTPLLTSNLLFRPLTSYYSLMDQNNRQYW